MIGPIPGTLTQVFAGFVLFKQRRRREIAV